MIPPLNILTLATLFPNSAAPNFGVFVARQTAALAARDGVRVTVINPIGLPPFPLSPHPRYRDLRMLKRQDRWDGLTVHRPRFTLLPGLPDRNPAAIARAALPLVRRLHAERPFDLIDAEFFYPDGPAARLIAAELGLPYTVKARGADVHYWGTRKGSGAAVRMAARDAAGMLAVCGALKDDMAALGMEADRIAVHYTGCDQARFRPVDSSALRRQLGLEGPVIATVGALIARKRQDLVIAALADLPGVTLLLIGKGEREATFRDLAQGSGVANRVRFVGAVAHDDLPQWLSCVDVLVSPSDSEGLANAWVEALACGTPVVISEAGGARELVTSDAAGRVVPQDHAAIAGAVRDILAMQPARADVRAAVERFSWARNGQELEAFFRRTLDGYRPR
ncbi:glycosyltransferase [Novosphingopyxis baekryungensis]|uniref:glycosyltransferase n=1 Tax=Novosphingopyxis baekryungensis TaxID=279369 RepID=UPI00068499EF|nr:glycosyltransferase [Novosphingopyxis baekryungensis]